MPSPMIPCALPLAPCQLGPQALLLLRGELTGRKSQRLYEKLAWKWQNRKMTQVTVSLHGSGGWCLCSSPLTDADKVTYPTFLSSFGPTVLAIVRWADSSYFSLCIYFDAVLGLQSSGKLWENLKVNIFQLFPAAHEFYLTSSSKRGADWAQEAYLWDRGGSWLLDFPV